MTEKLMRLEALLRMWEDRCFMASLGVRVQLATRQPVACPLEGPLVHWRDLRSYLLGYRAGQPFDSTRFLGSFATQRFINPDTNTPLELASWSADSRRAFRMSGDLQLLLEATDLGDFSLSEIPWPFGSFAIVLENPIDCSGGVLADVILVTTCYKVLNGASSLVQIHLLPQAMDEREFLPTHAIRDLEDAVMHRRGPRFSKLMDRWGNAAHSLLRTIFSIDMRSDAPVTGSAFNAAMGAWGPRAVHNLNPDITSYPHWDAAVRLVAGLCFYLKSLPAQSGHVSTWTRPASATTDWQAVINTAQVCSLSSAHTLTAEEHQDLRDAVDEERRGSTYQVRAHFRRGHWRRAPGKGDDPNSPRVVHVRPTLVRRDRLPEGAAPGGTETRIKK